VLIYWSARIIIDAFLRPLSLTSSGQQETLHP